MRTQDALDPQRWATLTFGTARLKDVRRTGRAVKAVACMAERAWLGCPSNCLTDVEREDAELGALSHRYQQVHLHSIIFCDTLFEISNATEFVTCIAGYQR